MSGGVDSALAAILLRREGYDCVGINMRTYHPNEQDLQTGRKFQTCCSPEDASDARAVATGGDFPFYVLDLENQFHDAVVKPFVENYLNGLTPNPCVLCNNYLKLGVLLEKAKAWGCEFVATGHYARVEENTETGRMELLRAADRNKDQTYYLFGLRQEQLRRFICPLAGMTKSTVRQLAREYDVPVHDKPDSMEICFVPQNDYRKFLRTRVAEAAIRPGDIVLRNGKVVGRHEGVALYTIGQRRGLGIAHAEPLYVIDLLPEEELVVVGPESETFGSSLVCDRTNWIAIEAPQQPIECEAQIRYRHAPAPALVTPLGNGRYRVDFDQPQRSIAPGQAVVFYEGDRVLGGGWIRPQERQEKVAPC
jgi:tRNA-specific 2-thiouridylase